MSNESSVDRSGCCKPWAQATSLPIEGSVGNWGGRTTFLFWVVFPFGKVMDLTLQGSHKLGPKKLHQTTKTHSFWCQRRPRPKCHLTNSQFLLFNGPRGIYYGCGSKKGTETTLLVKGKIDQNLWSPRVFVLTHKQI